MAALGAVQSDTGVAEVSLPVTFFTDNLVYGTLHSYLNKRGVAGAVCGIVGGHCSRVAVRCVMTFLVLVSALWYNCFCPTVST